MLTQPKNSWPKTHENHVKSVRHYSVHKSEPTLYWFAIWYT